MALRPPSDFQPPAEAPCAPSEAELRALWRRREDARTERHRSADWHRALDGMRRKGDALRPVAGARLPSYLREALVYGPNSRAALRPVPRQGRVRAVGLDTWSPAWYAPPGARLGRALRALATEPARRAWLLPERLGPYRVGWFPDSGLVFAEGRPGDGALLPAAALPGALAELERSLADLGVVVAGAEPAGLRRLDVAADLFADTGAEGLALLEVMATILPGAEKIATYRARHCLETVVLQSPGGRVLARFYDKGAEGGAAPRGRWLRFEAQWRLTRDQRPAPAALTPAYLRARFRRRFAPVWAAAGGIELGGEAAIAESLGEAVTAGRLAPSRARSLAGYLLLSAAGIPQGAERTVSELERECRELGLSFSLVGQEGRRVDLATVLDECLAPTLWGCREDGGEVSPSRSSSVDSSLRRRSVAER
ncbi:MAG TPA: hypothetical protein VHU86_08690 [Solirubrobacterales bacterium]|jgi:hypothetical protein|nr:hypothetical protein [Solirubrobacterales bacterium]